MVPLSIIRWIICILMIVNIVLNVNEKSLPTYITVLFVKS